MFWFSLWMPFFTDKRLKGDKKAASRQEVDIANDAMEGRPTQMPRSPASFSSAPGLGSRGFVDRFLLFVLSPLVLLQLAAVIMCFPNYNTPVSVVLATNEVPLVDVDGEERTARAAPSELEAVRMLKAKNDEHKEQPTGKTPTTSGRREDEGAVAGEGGSPLDEEDLHAEAGPAAEHDQESFLVLAGQQHHNDGVREVEQGMDQEIKGEQADAPFQHEDAGAQAQLQVESPEVAEDAEMTTDGTKAMQVKMEGMAREVDELKWLVLQLQERQQEPPERTTRRSTSLSRTSSLGESYVEKSNQNGAPGRNDENSPAEREPATTELRVSGTSTTEKAGSRNKMVGTTAPPGADAKRTSEGIKTRYNLDEDEGVEGQDFYAALSARSAELAQNTTEALGRVREAGAVTDIILQKMFAFLVGTVRSDFMFSSILVTIAYISAVGATLLPVHLVLCPRRFPTRRHREELVASGREHLIRGFHDEQFYVIPGDFCKNMTLSAVCQSQTSPEGIMFTTGLILFGVCIILSRHTFTLHSPWCFMKPSLSENLGLTFAATQSYTEICLRALLLLLPATGFVLTAALPSIDDITHHEKIMTSARSENVQKVKAEDSSPSDQEKKKLQLREEHQEEPNEDDDEEEAREARTGSNVELFEEVLARHVRPSRKYLRWAHYMCAPVSMFFMLLFETVQIFLGENVPVFYAWRLFGKGSNVTLHDVNAEVSVYPEGGPLYNWKTHQLYHTKTGLPLDNCQKRGLGYRLGEDIDRMVALRALAVLLGWLLCIAFVVVLGYGRLLRRPAWHNYRGRRNLNDAGGGADGPLGRGADGPLVPVTRSLFLPRLCFVLEVLCIYVVFSLPVLQALSINHEWGMSSSWTDYAQNDEQAHMLSAQLPIGDVVSGYWYQEHDFWFGEARITSLEASSDESNKNLPCGTIWDIVPGDQGHCPQKLGTSNFSWWYQNLDPNQNPNIGEPVLVAQP
ncbi:unnamed protein product [Amoebophrya sp. A120]|nr:unnamed protein product [Amoebophrya sp. A120]|eukprot:GSA120T00012467001.1